jgi:hypothetical protein
MTNGPDDATRRAMLQAAAGLAASTLGLEAGAAPEKAGGDPPAKIGEFNFLEGKWRIAHRQLKGKDWDTFEGEATCWTILGGAGSIEELRIPARNFAGLGIRLLDTKQRVWGDYWSNARDGVIVGPPTDGVFRDGVGTFISDGEDKGQQIKVRGVWDRITSATCRWRQGISRDGGKTWVDTWIMDWTRA